MGRKKKRAASNPRDRIFCYYCDRTFNTEQELLMHQREKHLRCPTCNKRMLSVPSLTIHSEQMHNIVVASVPNAIAGRTSVHIDVLGMKGVPEEYYRALEGGGKATKGANADYGAYGGANAYQGYAAQPYGDPYQAQQGYASQGYDAQKGYAAQQGYASHAYPQQAYPHHQQYPSHAYPAQQHYPAQHGYASQGYKTNTPYPAHQGFAAAAYPAHSAAYAQATYPTNSQAPGTQAYPAAYAGYPPTTLNQQAYQGQKSAQTQPSSAQRATETEANTGTAAVNGATGAGTERKREPGTAGSVNTSTGVRDALGATVSKASGKQSEADVSIVFDRQDVSMEELRAQLTRYRVDT